jgi:thiamine biosynthesis protein ThiI
MMEKYKGDENIDLEVVFLPWDDEIVIDIREDIEKKKKPLKLEKTKVIEIPFFEINHKFNDLNQEKTYLLYCEKWVLSNLHWLYLKEKWFNNIKVFRYLKEERLCGV